MNNLENNIFNLLKTKERANEFLNLSSSLKSYTHHTGECDVNEVVRRTFGENTPGWISPFISMLPGLSSGKVEESDIKILDIVEDMIKKSIQVKVEMSFQPSEDFIDKLLDMMNERENVGEEGNKKVLIDIDVKGDAEPGALFFIDGRFIDLTIRSQVISYLSSEDVVNRYL